MYGLLALIRSTVPNSDIDRKSAGFNERDERPKTTHPRDTMGVALIAEWAVVGPGDSPGIARNDHADLVRERERRMRNGSFSELVQGGLDHLQAECRALQLVEAVDLSENRRGDDDPCQVPSDEPQDGLVRIRNVDEHIGVTDEGGPRRSLHGYAQDW